MENIKFKDDAEHAIGDDDKTSLTSIADGLIEAMPEPQDHVINKQDDSENPEKTNKTDSAGTVFDRDIHKVDESDNPVIGKKGTFLKKRGAKKSTLNIPKNDEPSIGQNENACSVAGKAAANLVIMLGVVIGGQDFEPIVDEKSGTDEKKNLETAFGQYFVHKNIDDIPPGIALSVAIVGYALPRFTMPKTKTRMSKVKDWITKKLANQKLKKHGLKAVAEF